MIVEELMKSLESLPKQAEVFMDTKHYHEHSLGNPIRELNVEFDGRRTFIILTDYGTDEKASTS